MIKLKDLFGGLVKESHTISFTKDEMEILHRNGQLEKDGHVYVYDESLEERWGHSEHPEDDDRHKVKEDKKRDYKAEYKKFQSSAKSKKYRAELNKYNRKKGTYGNGDDKEASHKGGKIVGFEAQSKNRGRAEKSRLKKESGIIKLADLVNESTDVFDYNEMAIEQLESPVNSNARAWKGTTDIMENKKTYKIVMKYKKLIDRVVSQCDKELRRLKWLV